MQLITCYRFYKQTAVKTISVADGIDRLFVLVSYYIYIFFWLRVLD